MEVPEIVKAHVLKCNGRMPKTEEEIDQYLDLINHAKEYADSIIVSQNLSNKMSKKLGLKTPKELKQEGIALFKNFKKTAK